MLWTGFFRNRGCHGCFLESSFPVHLISQCVCLGFLLDAQMVYMWLLTVVELDVSPTSFECIWYVNLGHDSQVMVDTKGWILCLFFFFYIYPASPMKTAPVWLLVQKPVLARNRKTSWKLCLGKKGSISIETALQQHLMVTKHIADIVVAHPFSIVQQDLVCVLYQQRSEGKWKMEDVHMNDPFLRFHLLVYLAFKSSWRFFF